MITKSKNKAVGVDTEVTKVTKVVQYLFTSQTH